MPIHSPVPYKMLILILLDAIHQLYWVCCCCSASQNSLFKVKKPRLSHFVLPAFLDVPEDSQWDCMVSILHELQPSIKEDFIPKFGVWLSCTRQMVKIKLRSESAISGKPSVQEATNVWILLFSL